MGKGDNGRSDDCARARHRRAAGGRPGGGERRAVDVLHVGRVALYYLSLDGSETGQWNAERRRWEPMDNRYASAVRKGLKIARETAAADLFVLPAPAPVSGGEQ